MKPAKPDLSNKVTRRRITWAEFFKIRPDRRPVAANDNGEAMCQGDIEEKRDSDLSNPNIYNRRG